MSNLSVNTLSEYEYLPKQIVAYQKNRKPIHISKAKCNEKYFCPCCNKELEVVRSERLQKNIHFNHIDYSNCTKSDNMKWHISNWLFAKGSEFIVDGITYTVSEVQDEVVLHTGLFGSYSPDYKVTTTEGSIFYVELFFANRKRGSYYFCKWKALGIDVIDICMNDYEKKDTLNVIPEYKYLYHNGVCYSDWYVEKDLYANMINPKREKLFNEGLDSICAKLDLFWSFVMNHQPTKAIELISQMPNEEQYLCYYVAGEVQYLKGYRDDIKNIINWSALNTIENEVNEKLGIPIDNKIRFRMIHRKGLHFEGCIAIPYESPNDKQLFIYSNSKRLIYKFKTSAFRLSQITINDSDLEYLKECYIESCIVYSNVIEFGNWINRIRSSGYEVSILDNRTVQISDCDKNKIYSGSICDGIPTNDVFESNNLYTNAVNSLIEKVNYCKNHFWKMKIVNSNTLSLFPAGHEIDSLYIKLTHNESVEELKDKIYEGMKQFQNGAWDNRIRVLEV